MAPTRRIQIILVVEADPISRTDAPYYSWILKNHFTRYVSSGVQSDLKIVYDFVYMGGYGNYRSSRVKREIRSFQSSFPKGDTYVVYCLDYDNKGNDTKKRLSEIEEYCASLDYSFCLSYPEIEHVLCNARNGVSKVDAVAIFKRHYPKKNEIDEASLFCERETLASKKGQTNFGRAILAILKKVA